MQTSNEQLALQWIYQSKSATRSDLVDMLGISPTSVNRLVADLVSQGYVIERDSVDLPAKRGRPTDAFGINPECGYVAGVEFGREHLMLSYLAADGTLVDWYNIETYPTFVPSAATMDQLISIINRQAEQANIPRQRLRAVGLAVHDVVSADGEWVTWDQPFEDRFPARAYLTTELDCLVHVEDISRSFAFAEHRFGAGQGMPDMIYLFIGRHGVGSGIFVNDSLLRSSSGICGEIGHIRVEEDGVLCQCGNRGCLETVVTHKAVVARLQSRLAAGVVSSLSGRDPLTFADVCRAYADGDKEAHIALGQCATDLARALVGTINIVGANHVLIGGQLRLAGDEFAAELTSLLRKRLFPSLANRISVGFASLPPYAGAWGVAAQVLDAAWETGQFAEASD